MRPAYSACTNSAKETDQFNTVPARPVCILLAATASRKNAVTVQSTVQLLTVTPIATRKPCAEWTPRGARFHVRSISAVLSTDGVARRRRTVVTQTANHRASEAVAHVRSFTIRHAPLQVAQLMDGPLRKFRLVDRKSGV
jgi:hypothetical protein